MILGFKDPVLRETGYMKVRLNKTILHCRSENTLLQVQMEQSHGTRVNIVREPWRLRLWLYLPGDWRDGECSCRQEMLFVTSGTAENSGDRRQFLSH